jgi:hypothetical protein
MDENEEAIARLLEEEEDKRIAEEIQKNLYHGNEHATS